MTANISVTSSGLQLKTAPVGRTVGSLSQQEVLTFYTACFHTTQSTEPVPSHGEQQTISTQPGNHSPSAPRKDSPLKPCRYPSPIRALQHLPQHMQRMFTTKVKFKEGELCPGCPTSQRANEILTRTYHFSPQAVSVMYSLWLEAFWAHLS